MSAHFPEVHVGDPLRHGGLTVFPLSADVASPVEYLLSDEAISAGSVEVKEVSETGSIPDLFVENKGDVRVLFLEGEELVGAKQNRVLIASILVAAGSTAKIPVSCVEQGRWRYQSRKFRSGGTHSPSKLRYALKKSVSQSLKAELGHRADQGEVWDEVAKQQYALGAVSATGAMADTFEASKDRLAEFRAELKYVEGAQGMAVAVAGKIVCLDVFDKPATCKKVWDRFLSGSVLDALEAGPSDSQADVADVEKAIHELDESSWEPCQPVGEGQEQRAEADEGTHGSILSLDGSLVHASVAALIP